MCESVSQSEKTKFVQSRSHMVIGPCKALPTREMSSTKLKLKINYENANITGRSLFSPKCIMGNLITLKSLPMNQGRSHQLCTPTNFFHMRCLFLLLFDLYTPAKAHIKLSSILLKEHVMAYSLINSSTFSTIFLSHIINTPLGTPSEARYTKSTYVQLHKF